MRGRQNRREFLLAAGAGAASLAARALAAEPTASKAKRPPNFIVILWDNLGYGDIGCSGSRKHRTPHVDRMAREGMRLTNFYVTSGICTPPSAASCLR